MSRARLHLPGVFLLLAATLAAQPLTRVAATSLRVPANPPAAAFTTERVFPNLTFTQPVAVVTPPGETRRLFVVEKTGRIWVIPDVTAATPTRTLFLDLTARVATGGGNDERGLLALAFHPGYAGNGQFYVWWTLNTTSPAGTGLHDRLSRFVVSAADPNAADPASEQPLLTQRDEAGNHNGGELAFGPDGYLYLSLGDEGGANDQYNNSQRLDRDFFAGVIRIDVDRRPGSLAPNAHPAVHAGTYAVPPDNPWVGATTFNGAAINPAAVRTEFWAVGLRNPWRMAFDSATGRLWLGDVGQGTREEINVIVRGGNYGWSYREGFIAGPRANPPAAASATFLPPIWDYPNPAQGLSVTGGLVYRGPRLPALVGKYVFGDFVSGRIWALEPDGENPVAADRVQQIATDGGVSSFGLNPATGDLLIADLLENQIKRLVPAAPAPAAVWPATLSATGAFATLATLAPAPGVVAYEPNVSFWSDHARKRRWFALPDATSVFGFAADGAWALPTGAVWVKHFDLETTRGVAATARRIETRFLVKTAAGIHGATYRWNDAQTDATLVPDDGADVTFTIVESGAPRPQTWRFPSRGECLTCHTSAGGHALSFNTRQLNRGDFLSALAQAGYLSTTATPPAATLPALASADHPTASLEWRARSYLDANCASCHQPGGPALGHWDARSSVPLPLANLVNGPLIDNGGDAANRVIAPGDAAHSRLLQRIATRGPGQMPPLASRERDHAAESLLAQWIASLAAPPPPEPAARLINLAARAQVGAGADALFPGFVIGPGPDKTVLVRAVGPAMAGAPFNVPGTLADPVLTLLGPDSSTRVAASNDNWAAANAAVFATVGAFALPPGSRDAAIVARLAPGAYTAQVAGTAGGTGVALVEVYDVDPAAPGAARLINTAVRAQVGTGAGILIPGLVVGPGAAKQVLIRAVGPALGAPPFSVPGVLAQPVLTLFSGAQAVATNTAWNSAVNATAIRETARAVGAFALPEGGRDSAILATLPPGPYTIQVAGTAGTTGVALVEIYEVP
ncbi:MAG: PQQ-dependent sugar dehydrogenase [Opitutaceae bacterium]|nr:PQQ-dependent sugar dehydrogenase [Opitutaceae bacterium]